MDNATYHVLDARFRALMDRIAGGDVDDRAMAEATLLDAARAVARRLETGQSSFVTAALDRAARELVAAAHTVGAEQENTP